MDHLQVNAQQRVEIRRMSELVQWDVQLPPFQRCLDDARVERYCRENRGSPDKPVMQTGILLVRVEGEAEGKWYLPDGQHRWTTFRRMLDEDSVDTPVLLILTTCATQRDLYIVYRFVNDAFPLEVPLTEEECNTARAVAVGLNKQWPAAFSTAARPRRPNISQNALTEALARVVVQFGSVADAVTRITHFNNVVCPTLPDRWFRMPADKMAEVKRLKKLATKKLCYLGLFPDHATWIGLMLKGERDQRLVDSQERSIKHSFVWPTWDFTHPGEAMECPRELEQLTLLSPKDAIRLFGVPEVHAITRDNSSGFTGVGVVFGAQLPHEDQAEIGVAVSVALGQDGWLHAPCERKILVVSVDGERVVSRAALQQLAPLVTDPGVCPVKSLVI